MRTDFEACLRRTDTTLISACNHLGCGPGLDAQALASLRHPRAPQLFAPDALRFDRCPPTIETVAHWQAKTPVRFTSRSNRTVHLIGCQSGGHRAFWMLGDTKHRTERMLWPKPLNAFFFHDGKYTYVGCTILVQFSSMLLWCSLFWFGKLMNDIFVFP